MTFGGDIFPKWLPALLFLGISLVGSSQFRHIGCYKITSEISGIRFNYGTLKLDLCATGCNEEGFPFIAMREGRDCICVDSFGGEGKAIYPAMCNYTCRTEDFYFLCGGMEYEDVYYAVDTDKDTVLPRRDNILHNEPDSFDNARMSCVKQNGDLPILVSQKHIVTTWEAAKNTNYSGVWIGAYRDLTTEGKFEWGGLKITDQTNLLDISASSSQWSDDSSYDGSGHCVILLKADKKLKVVECGASYPYICFQIPPPETTSGTASTTPPLATTVETEVSFWKRNEWTIFWILLPIFLIVFVGSCLLYTMYSVWRFCRRYQRQWNKRDDVKPFVDIEEDNRPVTVRDVMVDNEGLRTPVEKINIEKEEFEMTKPSTPIVTSADNIKSQSDRKTLLSESDPDIDFTKLSINDILYIKTLVGFKKKPKAKPARKKALSST